MIGYIEIPLFRESTYETVGYTIRVPVLDREQLESNFNRQISYQTFRNVDVTAHMCGLSPNPSSVSWLWAGAYGCSDAGTPYQTKLKTPEQCVSMSGLMRHNFAENVLGPASVIDMIPNDPYNLFNIMDHLVNGEYMYFKNGAKVQKTVRTVDSSELTVLVFYNPRGQVLYNLGAYTDPQDIRAWTSTDGVRKSLAQVKNSIIETEGRGINNFAPYQFWYLYSDSSNIRDYSSIATRRAGYRSSLGSDSVDLLYPGGVFWSFGGSGTVGIWNGLLNNTSITTVEQIIEVFDGTYKDDVPDNENTYPGGGEDKNTYPEDGESGKGTFDNANDEVDFPSMPVWDATSTGFISLWNPTISEITALYGFLWDSDISTTLKKLFLEPMDAIISLAFFPVDPINFPEKRNVTIGHVDTEITMYAVQKQFVDFDFGELVIDEYYGAAWDYSPYTQASIYLPYIGTQALDIDDVMNGTLHLKYRVDLLSGMCAAMLRVDRSRDGLQAVIYTWQGNCAMQVPITAGSARDFLNSIIQLGAMAGVSLAQPLAGAIDASMHKGEENYQSSIMGNNWINPTIATFSALNVIGQKVRVQRGGRVDANAGVMSPQEAYIILNRPVSAIPKGWNEYAGYPSLKVKILSTQKGYTEIAYIKLNGLEATSDEIMELDGMLKGGVIL